MSNVKIKPMRWSAPTPVLMIIRRAGLPAVLFLLLVVGGTTRNAAQAAPPPTTLTPIYETGAGWAAGEYTVAIAFGDVDGDGRNEMAIARQAATGPRILLVDDATTGFALLTTLGGGWGVAGRPTAVAFGNVDGDPAAELVVARVSPVNERAQVFDDATAGYAPLMTFGAEWPAAVSAVGAAFGDVDGDGRAELGLISDATTGPRVFLYDDAEGGFVPLWSGAETWGAAATGTDIALGDADGDGDAEIAFSRNHDSNARYFVHDGPPDFGLLHQGGEAWGAGSFATAVAFGNVDDDPAAELGVTRRASLNERAIVLDDAAAGFATLTQFGQTWSANAWATDIAFGDADGDGRDEVALSRMTTINARVLLFDDGQPGAGRPPFALLSSRGEEWLGEEYATSVALGDVDGDGLAEMAYGRFATTGARVFVVRAGWMGWVPFVSNTN